MKLETKKSLERIAIFFSPIFTLIMFMLPYVATIQSKTVYNNISYQNKGFASYIDVLKTEGFVFAKVIMYIALVGVISTIVLYILSTVFKDKEKLLMKIGAIVLVVSTSILVLTTIESRFENVSFAGAKNYFWVSFMTPIYGLLLVYNVASLIYYLKKVK